jgi:hypothetical protein
VSISDKNYFRTINQKANLFKYREESNSPPECGFKKSVAHKSSALAVIDTNAPPAFKESVKKIAIRGI